MMFRKETEFQETEIGEFPKEWEVKKLGDFLLFKNGKRPNIINEEGEIPVYGANGIMGYTNDYLVNYDTIIIIGRVGAAGKVHLARGKIWVSDNAIYAINRNKSKAYLNFIFYLLSYLNPGKFASKTTHPIITQKSLENLKVPLPPLEEQKRIANILSMIDSGIEAVDRAIAKLEGMKRALLNELLTGRIRVREENGKLTFYKETEFQETEIGEIPKDWKLVKLSTIAEDIYYGITAKAVEHKTGLKMLRTTDIKDYNVDWDSLPFCEITEKRGNIQRFLLKKGDIIIARAGTTGVCVLVEKDLGDVIFGSYLIKVRLNKNVYPRFIYYFCQSRFYWNQITSGQAGSTIKNINLPLLKSLNVPLPSSVKEQTAIAEILSTVDKAIELYRREKERLLRLRRGLMSVILTGRVRVVSDVRDVGWLHE